MHISSKEHLIAANYTIEEIRESINADTLAFLSVESLLKTPIGAPVNCFCTGCFTGEYPMEVPKQAEGTLLKKGC